jgi:two-component system, cell cycle sensor histidine kinase and response regulator CckA
MHKKNVVSSGKPISIQEKNRPTPSKVTRSRRMGATLAQLVDVMDIAMWVLDLEYRVVEYNEKARQIYGDHILGDYCYRIADKSDRICGNCPAKWVYEGHAGGRAERKRIDSDGNEIYIDHIATPIKDNRGELTGVLVFIIDITKHKLMEEELLRHRDRLEEMVRDRTQALREKQAGYRKLYERAKQQETLYRSLLESSVDAIAIYDLDGRVIYINPSFTETFGWPLEELKNRKIPYVPASQSEVTKEKIRQVVKYGHKLKYFKTQRSTKDGRVLDVEISATRHLDHLGRPAGILVVLRDNTRAKALEAQLQQSKKMEAIGTLAGGVAHDFNNILMGIQGRASLMMSETGEHSPYHEHLASIQEYIKSATDLTKQLLGFARGGKYEVKAVNLNDLIEKSIEMFGRTKKEISIHKRLNKQLWNAAVDRQQIEQVLLNLYVNAWQAMPGGGNLYLSSDNFTFDKNQAKPFEVQAGDYVMISITDTGVGMDSATIQKVFEPFFTTKEMGRGTGLGLASAYGIIKNHNGFITVYSEKGHGSTFNIYLPATADVCSATQTKTPTLVGGDETILLLDDEQMVLDVGRPMLEKMGYGVHTASRGPEAIDIYSRHQAEIDLVIIDMIMPEMNGGEVYDRLKQIDPDVRVLLSSGYSMNCDAKEILSRGCNGFIQKPFGLYSLSRKIRTVLDSDVPDAQ